MENDRPFWAKTMINIATGVTFGFLVLIVALVLLKILAIVANWAVG